MSYKSCSFKESWWRTAKHYPDRALAEYLRGLLAAIFDNMPEPPPEKELMHLGWFNGHRVAVNRKNASESPSETQSETQSETPSESPSETQSETQSETPSESPSTAQTKYKKELKFRKEESEREGVAPARDVLTFDQVFAILTGPDFDSTLRPPDLAAVAALAREFVDSERGAGWLDNSGRRRLTSGEARRRLVGYAKKFREKNSAARAPGNAAAESAAAPESICEAYPVFSSSRSRAQVESRRGA